MATTANQPTAVPPVPHEDDGVPPIHWTTEEEGRAMFDDAARAMLGISGEEFLRRYDAGEYSPVEIFEGPDHGKLVSLEMLIPFARTR